MFELYDTVTLWSVMKTIDVRGINVIVDDDVYEEYKDVALYVNRYNYTMITRLRTPLHRIITDCPEGLNVDHINGNKLDNRRENLRICTQSQNTMNRGKANMTSTSRFKGVCWEKQKSRWRAVIYKGGKRKHLGYYRDEEDAARAYNDAVEEIHGEFGVKNVI